ncbi:MAG: hypothetical protein H6510_11150 [Acidobacteria bacterium]|nr:hypothetical protein [Acidobacteriota bacterium]
MNVYQSPIHAQTHAQSQGPSLTLSAFFNLRRQLLQIYWLAFGFLATSGLCFIGALDAGQTLAKVWWLGWSLVFLTGSYVLIKRPPASRGFGIFLCCLALLLPSLFSFIVLRGLLALLNGKALFGRNQVLTHQLKIPPKIRTRKSNSHVASGMGTFSGD